MTTEDLYKQYRTLIFHYCYKHLEDYFQAEDATQEVFLRAHQAIATIPEKYAKQWLFKVTIRYCIDLLRHRNLKTFVGLHTLHGITELPDIETQLLIIQTWESLPEGFRVPLFLYYEQDKSISDISIVTGLPYATIKMRLFRGRAQWKAYYLRHTREEQAA